MAFRAGVSPSNPILSYMYPKPLCIQSKMAGSWHAGPVRRRISQDFPKAGHSLMGPISSPAGGFYPGREPLSRTDCSRGTRPPEQRSLPNRRYRDETSIRCGHACRPLPVIILRFRQPRPGSGGSLSRGPQRDRAPRRPPDAGGSADPVDAGRQPGEMAPRPYHLVLRAIPARRALRGLQAVSPRLRLSVQFLLCQRRPAARPPPARPPDPSRRRRNHRLPPACRRRRREILSRGRRGRARRDSRRWSKSASITSSSTRN